MSHIYSSDPSVYHHCRHQRWVCLTSYLESCISHWLLCCRSTCTPNCPVKLPDQPSPSMALLLYWLLNEICALGMLLHNCVRTQRMITATHVYKQTFSTLIQSRIFSGTSHILTPSSCRGVWAGHRDFIPLLRGFMHSGLKTTFIYV